jgi:hypothetical protein
LPDSNPFDLPQEKTHNALELERLQLLPSRLSPQPLLAAQSFVERHRLQLVHDSRARLHPAVPVPQQLPQIAILPTRHPDPRKVIFQQEFQNQLRILAIGLLLAHSPGSDLGCVADPQLDVELGEQSFKLARLSTGFHAHTHLHSLGREIAIELLRFLAVLQSSLSQFSGVGVHKSNLLEGRVVIASYNHHVRLLSPEPFGWSHHQSLLGPGSRHCYGINYTHLSIPDGSTGCDPNRK